MCEVFVGRADDDLREGGVVRELRGGARQRVIGLELDHRPYRDPQRGGDALGDGELRPQQRVHPLAGLVAGEEVVAERLDHMVECDPHVGDVVLPKQPRQGAHQGTRRADLAPVAVEGRGRAVVHAEELVGPVDQMRFHSSSSRSKGWSSSTGMPTMVIVSDTER